MSRTRLLLNQIDADRSHHIDYLLYYLTLKKLDNKTLEDWEMAQQGNIDIAAWADFETYIMTKAKALENITHEKQMAHEPKKEMKRDNNKSSTHSKNHKIIHHATTTGSNVTCVTRDTKTQSEHKTQNSTKRRGKVH